MSFFHIKDINVIFCHIPKTGGTSIRKGIWKKKGVTGPVKGKPLTEWNMERSLGFVREPLDRFISGIRYGIKRGYLKKRDAVQEGLDIAVNGNLQSPYRKISFMTEHLLPQTHPEYYLHKVKYVGKFENLQEDFDSICHELNVKGGPLPILNKTSSKIKIDIPDNLMNDIINFYYNDYISLGYPFPDN